MKARIKDIAYSESGECLVTFMVSLKEKERLRELRDSDLELAIDKFKEKRSKTANSYMWALCERIAEAVDITKEDVYRDAIKHMGVFKDYEEPEDRAVTLQIAWEKLGIGWLVETDVLPNDMVLVRCYYGSSSYNSRQMSRLVDYVVNEAKNLGIETLPEDEINRLKSLWEDF